MKNQNVLGEALSEFKKLWRTRPELNLLGKRIWDDQSVPGAILEVVDYLYPIDKPRPLLSHKHKTKNGWSMAFTLQPGNSFNELVRHKDFFESATGCKVNFERNGKILRLTVTDSKLAAYYPFEWCPDQYFEKMALPVPVGYSVDGLEVIDLAGLPHMRIGGTTFTGKSNFLHNVFIALSMLNNVRLAVIDLALLEFSYAQDVAAFASDTETALKLLLALEREMHRRRKVLNDARVVKIQEYKGDMPYIILLVDEFAFMQPDGATDKVERELRSQCQTVCANLAALARKVGIHCIYAMQRPDHKILPGQLKANLPGALSFRTIDRVNSEIILDNGAAAELPDIQGRAIWQVGNRQKEVQVMHLPIDKARKILEWQKERLSPWRWEGERQAKRLLPR